MRFGNALCRIPLLCQVTNVFNTKLCLIALAHGNDCVGDATLALLGSTFIRWYLGLFSKPFVPSAANSV